MCYIIYITLFTSLLDLFSWVHRARWRAVCERKSENEGRGKEWKDSQERFSSSPCFLSEPSTLSFVFKFTENVYGRKVIVSAKWYFASPSWTKNENPVETVATSLFPCPLTARCGARFRSQFWMENLLADITVFAINTSTSAVWELGNFEPIVLTEK